MVCRLLLVGWAIVSFELALASPGINFIENNGQWPAAISFFAKIQGAGFDIQKGKFRYTFLDQQQIEERHLGVSNYKESGSSSMLLKGHVLISSFLGFNPESKAAAIGIKPQYYNYFLGDDRRRWQSSVHAYEGVIFQSFYSGVDLKVYSEGENLKYDFIVDAGADASQIQWQYEGAESVLKVNGDVVVKTPLSEVVEKKPIAYQWIAGRKVFVQAEYQLVGGRISFRLGTYDRCFPLVIDPLLIFSTYSGSTADNWGSTATPGGHGTLYSSGITNFQYGGTFPATPGSFQTNYGGFYDVAILKYDSLGHQLLYASYLGGSYSESPHSLVIDKDENLLVLGTTSSYNFPTTNGAFSRTFSGGIPISQSFGPEIPIPYENGSDIFITKISKDGTQLLASTYLGGTSNDGLNSSFSPLVKNYGDQMRGDIIGDPQGNIYVSTVTASPDFPVQGGFNSLYGGGESDALILEMTGDLNQMKWGAFFGGNAADASHTIKVDKTGNIFVGGGSSSTNFPTTAGAYQPSTAGDVDGWIAKIAGDGSAVLKSTLTGTSLFNQVYFLDLDQSENVYVYGQTVGAFPVTTGVYNNPNSGQFIQKFDNSLSTLLLSTVFGSGIGIPNISPTAFLVNECNNLFLSGWGGSINSNLGYWNSSTVQMPVTPDAYQKNTSGSDFYFIVLSKDASKLLYATFLGGNSSRTHVDGGTCRFDKHGIVYHAVCAGCAALNATFQPTSDFPTTSNAWSRTNNSANCNNAAFKFDLATLRAIIQTNTIHLDHPGITEICTNEKFVLQNLSEGGQEFDWKFGEGIPQTKNDTSQIIFQYKNAGQFKINLKAIDNGTCASEDSTYTVINVYRPQGIAGTDQTICSGRAAHLVASGGVSYQWVSADKSFTSDQPSLVVSPQDTTDYYITINDGHCTAKDTITIKVVPGIDLKFKAEAMFGCEGRPAVKVSNQTDSDEDVFFDFGDGAVSDETQVTHSYQTDGKYNVQLVGKKEFCTYTKSVTLPVYYRFIPNVITPEGSPGLNDAFMVQYGDQKPSPGVAPLTKISLKVYNRWGKLMYENADYKNDWSAKNVDSGTYYFDVNILGECNCKSWLEIIK